MPGRRVAGVPARRLEGAFWHHGPTRRDVVSCADPAVTDGRYHAKGGSGVWYASDQEQAAWAELFRHFIDEVVDPFEIVRRVGRVHVALDVLDLTDASVRDALGVTLSDLVGDDYVLTRAIAVEARMMGVDGLLAPSAALPGRRTLVVFGDRLADTVTLERSVVRQPPPRIVDHLASIRSVPEASRAVRRRRAQLTAAGREAIRRQRRRRR